MWAPLMLIGAWFWEERVLCVYLTSGVGVALKLLSFKDWINGNNVVE